LNLIYDYTKEELSELIKPNFRVKQIFNWLYKKYVNNFDEMKNLPNELKATLKSKFEIDNIKIASIQEAKDGTKKYLFKLADNHTIETVFLKMKEKKIDEDGVILSGEKYTVCISTQVGCKVGCSFCLTAKGGFIRNLSAGEIIYQLLAIKKENDLAENKSLNIVYMGMGEPLDNFDNLIKAIKIFSDLDGLAIAPRRQTISTSGISTKIEKLGKLDLGVNIAISLHSVDDKLRQELIPMNKAYNIKSIIDAIKKFPIDERKRVMFEYLIIKDVNDDLESAKKLIKLLDGIKAKVNLIYFNPHEGSIYKRPSEKRVVEFQEYLINKGLLCTIRQSKGIDIDAACGQLREKILGEDNEKITCC
jgi:23S rRNA (adenine2503-C2)-methyltransferase